MMKNAILRGTLLAAIGLTIPAMGQSWTGFYLNGGIGRGSWTADTTVKNSTTGAAILPVRQTQGGDGWFEKIGLGYDYQVNPHFVVGGLADYDFSNLKGSIQDQGPFWAGDIKQKSAWALGARAGWLPTPSAMAYLVAGRSHANFSGTTQVSTIIGTPQGSTPSFSRTGWFGGIGLEAHVTGGWFVRGEYRIANYGKTSIRMFDLAGTPTNRSYTFDSSVQTTTVQVLYKF